MGAMKTRRFEMRLSKDLDKWLAEQAELRCTSKTQLVTQLIVAAKEGRLRLAPNPFPAEEHNARRDRKKG